MSRHKRARHKQHLPPSADDLEAILEAERLRLEQWLKQAALSVDWQAPKDTALEDCLGAERLRLEAILSSNTGDLLAKPKRRRSDD